MSGHVDLSKLEVKESREYHHGTTLIYHVIEERETNMITARGKEWFSGCTTQARSCYNCSAVHSNIIWIPNFNPGPNIIIAPNPKHNPKPTLDMWQNKPRAIAAGANVEEPNQYII